MSLGQKVTFLQVSAGILRIQFLGNSVGRVYIHLLIGDEQQVCEGDLP